jgi:hypothetical protein
VSRIGVNGKEKGKIIGRRKKDVDRENEKEEGL